MNKYKIIEHTADIGIHVTGKNLKDIFVNSAEGMFKIIIGECQYLNKEDFIYKILLTAENREALLFAWLNELLFLSETQLVIINQFKLIKLTDYYLEAEVRGVKMNRLKHRIEKEIKAVTYHCLEIRKDKKEDVLTARVIFDI